MADELERELGIQSELIESSGGVFEIEYAGKLLFSKKKSGRFPNEGEIKSLMDKI